ncbi:MAG: 2,3,4,5-tetrahydropyridine-2,6-dicarboxylate N-succinyltransferase [Proteobacteria bacterium]|nr:2,3,4,5-tetrahydropyridine-2,6-dicarboxylate N-succinyltransferase [Pseudomonadota bacterium]
MLDHLIETIEHDLAASEQSGFRLLSRANEAFAQFLDMLETGEVRAAAPDASGVYQCDIRVKKLILLGFKLGHLVESEDPGLKFCDKHNLWPDMRNLVERAVRIVPGGTAVRRGACLRSGVTVMPPAYVNIGAYIDEGTMIDSHALVGSCAQVGKRCHISAASQLGGVLEPVGAMPVIIEDNAFIGGNCGIYEGAHVHKGAVIAAGTILTKSTPLFDLVHQEVIRPVDGVLHVPENAVVIPGSRAIDTDFAKSMGLSAYAPIIVKYRDDKTDASIELVDLFRQK